MRVRVISPFKLQGNEICAGTLLDVPDNVMDKLKGKVVPVTTADIDEMQSEYMKLLALFWSIDDDPPGIGDEEADRVLSKLDVLFRELHWLGVKVPVRLPLERSKAA